MIVSAQQIFKELEAGTWRPFYLVVGEEPFQSSEILSRLKVFLSKGEIGDSFNYEAWDGEGLDAAGLLASLETLPGLFDGEGTKRLVVCQRFDKVTTAGLEVLDSYFRNPLSTTCFVLLASKVDKRKAWVKCVDEKGAHVEVNEPYERDWPKWQGYLERKTGKKVESNAWEVLLDGASRSLSLVWAELQKLAIYVGEKGVITRKDVIELSPAPGGSDVFDLVDDVLCRRKEAAVHRYQRLLRSGESEIKILSLFVRQFRLVDNYQRLAREGVTDSKVIAPQIGVHPFLVSKIKAQAQHHTPKSLAARISELSECDYHMKIGEGHLFEDFLIPYFNHP